jgi:hypothetical protein
MGGFNLNLCYSNNGMSFRAVAPEYVLQAGEILFDHYASAGELQAAFPGYAAAYAAVQAPQIMASNLASGITIVSGGSSNAPVATFAMDQLTQTQLAGIASTVAFTGNFPNGGTTFVFPDINSMPQIFPSVAAFKAFYAAYVLLLYQMNETMAILAAGGGASWPSQEIALQ